MSKLSFRARALDASKPMPIYLAEELPDLPDYSAINRAVPQMPSGMEKEEECEHHLQRAICAGLIIPTPEVAEMADPDAFDRLYPSDYRMPRQLIHMQPLGLEQDVPDYDMDSEDEKWLKKQQVAAGARRSDLTELKFEETMERLERGSGQTVVTLREARALAGRTGPADHLLAAVYDYWLNKRLATQQPLLLAVRTEARPGAPAASPYLAFRRRTEKMQTRKNRKNDESSYEKMVKLRRELSQAVSLLELIKKREKAKREMIRLAAALTEKRYAIKDFNGHLLAEAAAARVAVAPPLLAPPYIAPHHRPTLDPANRQREKRQYKRRKHRHHSSTVPVHTLHHVGGVSGSSSSSEGEAASVPVPDPCGPFAFRRKPGCQYHMPTASFGPSVEVPWRSGRSKENTSPADPDHRFKYSLTSLSYPSPRFIGLARRRMGRGGRVILDRITGPATLDRLWAAMDYTLTDSNNELTTRLDHTRDRPECAAETARKPALIKQEPADTYEDITIGVKRERIDDPYDSYSEKLDSVFSSRRTSIDDNRICNVDGPSLLNEQRSELNDERLRPSVEDDDDLKASSVDSIISKYASLDRIADNSDMKGGGARGGGSGGKFSWTAREGSRREQLKVLDEDVKWVTEMLVKRGLRKRLIASQNLDREHIDDVLKDCIHFRPQSPPVSPSQPVQTPQNPPDPHENEVKLTKHAPITVHVRLALPENANPPLPDKPSDVLFRETSSPYVTSEFTLADLYGDSLLPDTEILNINTTEQQTKLTNCWGHTNGPDAVTEQSSNKLNSWNDVFKASLLEDVNNTDLESKAASFKGDLSENSSSNHTSVFISSEGPPSSYSNSECDSNHALATNGLNSEWNDSNGSDRKFKAIKLNHEDDEHGNRHKRSSDCVTRLGSSIFKVGVNNTADERIFLTAEKMEAPIAIVPDQPISNKSLVNVGHKATEHKRLVVTSVNDSGSASSSANPLPVFQVKNQGSAQSSPSLVQVRTNSLVVNNTVNNIHGGSNKMKDIRSQIVMRGSGGSFQLANASGQTASIVQVSNASAGLTSANVRQLVTHIGGVQHQRKVVQDSAAARRNQDDQSPVATIASFVPSNQSLAVQQAAQNQKRSSPQPSHHQQHQVVTVSIPPEALKLRLTSDLMALVPRYKPGVTGANIISKDGAVSGSPRRAVVQLPNVGSAQSGLHPKQVKLLHARPLTTSLHRSRIIATHQHPNQTLHNTQQQHHMVQHSVGGTVTGRPVQFRGVTGLLQVQVRSPHHSHNNNRHQRMYAAAQPDSLENASPQLVESISNANPGNVVTPQTSQLPIISAAIGTTTSSPASTANINNIAMTQSGKGGGGAQQATSASQGSANNNNAAASRKGQAPPLPMEVT